MAPADDVLAVAMRASAIGMAIVTPEGQFVEVNPALCTILGRTAEQLHAATWQSLTHPDDLVADEALVASVLAGTQDAYRIRKRYLRPDGSVVHGDLSVGCVRDASGSVEFFISQIVDVSAEVEAQERYRILAENISDVVAVGSNDGVMQWISGAVDATLGYSAEELVGRTFRSLVHPDDLPIVGLSQQRRNDGEGAEFETRLATRDGGYRWMSVRVRPTFDESGVVTGRIGSWWDIDAQHAAREQQEQADARYRMLVENSADTVLHVMDGVVAWATPGAGDMLGWGSPDVAGTPLAELFAPEEREVVSALLAEVRAGVAGRRVLRRAGYDGDPRWIELALRQNEEPDGSSGAVGQAHDVTDRVIARNELAQAEQRWRDALNAFREPFLTFQGIRDEAGDVADLRYTYLNAAAEAALGRPAEEFLGRGLIELFPSNATDGIFESYRSTLTTGTPHTHLVEDFDENGVRGSFELDSFPFGDEVIVTGRDVTERKRFEHGLARSREEYRLIAENASDVVFRGDALGNLEWVSPSIERVLGLDPGTIQSVNLAEILHPDDLPAVIAASEQLANGGSATYRARFTQGDGSYRWCEVTARPVIDAAGTLTTRVGSLRDVHEQVMAEQALAEAEERFRLVAEHASDAIVRVGLDGTIDWVSGSIRHLAGREAADLVGVPAARLFVPEDVADEAEWLASVIAGAVRRREVRLQMPDGGTHWVSRRTEAVRDGEGNVRFLVSTWRDAQAEVDARTALEESEQQARELAARYEVARNEAMEAGVAKTAFLSRMSHELRTPLNAILGFGQILQMDELTDDQQESVTQILGGGRLLLDLINEILDISRIEAGRLTLSLEPVSVSDVVAESLDMVRPQAAAAGIVLEPLSAGDCAAFVQADRQRLIQILLNLLTNAVKYNRPSGSVRVTCLPEHEGVVGICVTDTGIGIATADLPYLFRPFERLGAASTDVEGTGIGLSLASGLARVMGGRIEVESSPGSGSTFTVLLPHADAPDVVPPTPRPDRTSPAVRRTRVLYVEDNPANARLVTRIVADRPGVHLVIATTGAEGLDVALTDPPDLVLLDLHLPDLPGEDVLRRLRTQPATSAVPVVVVTADASPAVRRSMLSAGARAVLTKPVNVPDVLAWIDDPQRKEEP